MIDILLSNQINKDISFYTMSQTQDSDGMMNPPVYTLLKTVEGLYWKANGSKNNVSDKYKEQVTACIIVDPIDIAEVDLITDMKINVSGEGDYMLIYGDDVGGQGKVLQINVKELA